MNFLTHTHMKLITLVMSALLCFVQGSACVGHLGDPPKLVPIFELPPPWVVDQQDGSATIGGDPVHPERPATSKVAIISFRRGTDADASQAAHNELQQELDNASAAKRLTKNLGGHKVYVVTGPDDTIVPSGTFSSLFFEKDGSLIEIVLYEALDQRESDLSTMIKTLRFEARPATD